MAPIVRAEGYRLLGRCFGYPDPAELREDLLGTGDVPELAPVTALGALVEDAMFGEFTRLFATRMPVPPYETSYIRQDKGARLGQIAMFYESFGVALGEKERENPDYIGTELEFAALLGLKLALAENAGTPGDTLATTQRARQIFVQEHLGSWVPTFAGRLAAAAEHPFYEQLALTLGAWLAADLAEHGWEPPAPEPTPVGEEPECLTCPMAPKEA